MRQLKGWVALATLLAFLAGTGLGAIFGYVLPDREASGAMIEEDADRYVRRFDEQIGLRNDAQRDAIRSVYEGYWSDIRALRDEFLQTHSERVGEVQTRFNEQMRRILDAEQEREWVRQTNPAGRGSGPKDSDGRDGEPGRREGE